MRRNVTCLSSALALPSLPVFWNKARNNNAGNDLMADTGNDGAALAATQEGVLDTRTIQILGIMIAHDGRAAFLRAPHGAVARVHVGDSVFGLRVTGIDDRQVTVIDRWQQSSALTLPGD